MSRIKISRRQGASLKRYYIYVMRVLVNNNGVEPGIPEFFDYDWVVIMVI